MMSIERLDNLIRRAPPLIFIGFAIGGLAKFTDFGMVIAFHLVALPLAAGHRDDGRVRLVGRHVHAGREHVRRRRVRVRRRHRKLASGDVVDW